MAVDAVDAAIPPCRTAAWIARRVIVYVLLDPRGAPLLHSVHLDGVTSFKTMPDSVNFSFIPNPFTTAAWHTVWSDYDFKLYIRNSLFLAVVVTAANMFLAASAATRSPGCASRGARCCSSSCSGR